MNPVLYSKKNLIIFPLLFSLLSCSSVPKEERNLTPAERLIRHASRNEASLVKADLSKGLSPSSTNSIGMTALMAAAFKGNLESMTVLFDYGASLSSSDDQRSTALHFAVQGKQPKSVQMIADQCKKLTPAECSVILNAKDQFGITPLMFAAHLNQYDSADILIRAGSGLEETNDEGWTALFFASSKGHSDLIQRLLLAHANTEAQDIERNTPLFWAVESTDIDSISTLVKGGAKVTHVNVAGKNLRHIANETKNKEVIKLINVYLENKLKKR